MEWLQAFFQANREAARKMRNYLPQREHLPFRDYEEVVAQYMNRLGSPVVLDVGGGRKCSFSQYRPLGAKLICLDISPEELAHNEDADELVLADATREIPLPEASVDLVVSRAVLEHLESPQAFLQHSYRVLRPGGFCIHVLPCKFALFALINQILPHKLGRKMLLYCHQSAAARGIFPAYYHRCYNNGMKRLFVENGFQIEEIRRYYFQSFYFEFFLPLFLLSALYEICTRPFKNLASFLLVVAQKPRGSAAG